MDTRTYDDGDLAAAVKGATSWRGVLRSLGLAATSSGNIASVRRHAERLNLDHSHFRGTRSWSDEDLARAVRGAASWTDVARTLGLSGTSSFPTLKGHALRLGLDFSHLTRAAEPERITKVGRGGRAPNLRRAGTMIAAAWFALDGWDVSWPLEPTTYDLVAIRGGRVERIQVKTTTQRDHKTWAVWITRHGATRVPYDPDDIDAFFIVDGELRCYFIPIAAVGGRSALRLSSYANYEVAPIFRPTG